MKKKKFMNLCFIVLLSTLLAAGSIPYHAQAKKHPFSYDDYKQVDVGKDGMVATAHPLASQIGADVLKKGGNAIDAAVAIQFALNVTEPMMSGIGGGGFMMVYDAKTKDTTIIDSRERAPAGATPDMFLDENGKAIPFSERVTKGTAVGVPGTLKGLEKALDKWGTRSMKQLITPSIKLASKGFPIDSVLADAISDYKDKLSHTAAKDVFLPDGEPLKEGDTLIQKDLAKTFTAIKYKGTKAFYDGAFSKKLAETVQEFGGSMTEKDIKNFNVTIDEPIWGDYQGYHIATAPPPSSGGVFLLQMLNLLDDFKLSQYDIRSWQKYQLLAETMHLAYADRAAFAGDPEFVTVPLKGLLNPDYINARRQLIDIDKVNKKPKAGDPWAYQEGSANYKQVEQPTDKQEGQTTHFTVTDRFGNVVSYTTTIEQLFGSGIMVPGYGVVLNNELTDFDAVPGGANEVQPNKRPLSSMTPTILFKNNEPVLTVGSPGGATIISSVLQTILNKVEYGMDLKAAVEEPRIYTNSMTSYRYEKGVPEEARTKLNEMGHKFGSSPVDIGNVQSILIDRENGTFTGVADSSRNGAAIGVNLKNYKK
ncbi:gamma-glutamyltransferase [Bacillus amyloliquefaciens]|uniref:gamma-glutamyltransferase n=1 Tax=Bacillus amyloliquefaciens group TaxID=1938374 RepID=UPI001E412DEC|nr:MULTISPECIES: gamma-glutamyltransferase [Bacillus amyloliquefaciens group]MCC8309997.1 gamma-glutamyltransferase [Bacillus velezensis]MCD5428848.1 gamma-glutamyltransferase [Bacillus amyloliquefaciens]MCO7134018.1 gamma-glutamyltransferase [Bacillus velezensis]MCO7141875.1 gamma-glutamyltransferase [Bacillus velezensis]